VKGLLRAFAASWFAFVSCLPVCAQSLTFAPAGTIPAPVDLIRVEGTHAYVSSGRTLTIYDVSNADSPKREGSYTFPEEIWSFRVVGTTAYVGANFFGLSEPSGSSGNDWNSGFDQAAKILRRSFRIRKFNRHIDSLQLFAHKQATICILGRTNHANHLASVFRHKALHDSPHPSVADNGNAQTHPFTSPPSSR
jgi:hypothetical protein